MDPEILVFGRHCSANFQTIGDCFMQNFKLKYEDSKTCENRSCRHNRFQLTSNQTEELFWGTPGINSQNATCFLLH